MAKGVIAAFCLPIRIKQGYFLLKPSAQTLANFLCELCYAVFLCLYIKNTASLHRTGLLNVKNVFNHFFVHNLLTLSINFVVSYFRVQS